MAYAAPPIAVRPVKASLRTIPLHFAATCFTGALVTDIVYSQSMQMMWTNFSAWLLFAGAVMGAVALLAGLIDAVRGQLMLSRIVGWLYVIFLLAAFAAAIFNSFVHSRDAWTSVVPEGLAVSAATFLLMVIATFLGMRVNRLVRGGF